MLEQVGEPAFLFGFEHRADVHSDTDRHLTRRNLIVSDGVTQTVGQDAKAPCRVARNIAARIEPAVVLGLRRNRGILLRGGGR